VQGHLGQIHWTPQLGARRPLVAVLDTGADGGSPDLRRAISVGLARSFVDEAPLQDRSGHGTHVAGLIAATTDNGIGGAGVSNARLMIIKIADAQGRATTSTLVRGIKAAVAGGAKVINISFGGAGFSQLEQDAILEARRAGVLVVAAAGNSGRIGSPTEYPGAYRHVLTVGATRGDGQAIAESTRGPQVALAAPGKQVLSTAPGGRFARRTGTSMATAIVSGTAARVLARRPALDVSQVQAMLVSSAFDVGVPGRDDATGAGRVDLAAALVAVPPAKDSAEPNDDAAQARRLPELLSPGSAGEVTIDGSVEGYSDARDDYGVVLGVGDVLQVDAASGAPELDVDLVVWKPGAPAFAPGPAYTRDWLVASALRPGSTEMLRYVATEAGTYAVEVQGGGGRGAYRLTVRRTTAPPPPPPT
jgi:subtilisin family serine protease